MLFSLRVAVSETGWVPADAAINRSGRCLYGNATFWANYACGRLCGGSWVRARVTIVGVTLMTVTYERPCLTNAPVLWLCLEQRLTGAGRDLGWAFADLLNRVLK